MGLLLCGGYNIGLARLRNRMWIKSPSWARSGKGFRTWDDSCRSRSKLLKFSNTTLPTEYNMREFRGEK
jgi:hypothetical protein